MKAIKRFSRLKLSFPHTRQWSGYLAIPKDQIWGFWIHSMSSNSLLPEYVHLPGERISCNPYLLCFLRALERDGSREPPGWKFAGCFTESKKNVWKGAESCLGHFQRLLLPFMVKWCWNAVSFLSRIRRILKVGEWSENLFLVEKKISGTNIALKA